MFELLCGNELPVDGEADRGLGPPADMLRVGMGEGFVCWAVPPLSTVNRPFLDPVEVLTGFAVILTVVAEDDDAPAAEAGELPCGRGAMGRGKICRRRLAPELVELVVDWGLSFELAERGDGPTTGGDGVLVEMVDGVCGGCEGLWD